jgi:agmatinase
MRLQVYGPFDCVQIAILAIACHVTLTPMTHDSFAFQTNTAFGGFLNAPHPAKDPVLPAPFAVAGIAWDGCVTNRPGARFGPYQIRRASHMLCDATHPLWQIAPHATDIVDYGDLTLPNTSLESMRAAMMPQVQSLIAKHHMLWLGGDHSITLPLLRAYKKHYGKPLALVHFDAHCDTWTDHFGEPSGHGTWTYEAIAEGLVDPKLTTQIGIRSAGKREAVEYVNDQGGRVFTARQLRGRENEEQLSAVIAHVKERVGDAPVYLSLDIDCLDPAFAPGTGTPEPGGMTSNQVLTLLEAWQGLNWVGMDLCEVAPPYDHAELTSNAAAVFLWTYLSGRLLTHRKDVLERTMTQR